MLRCSVNKIATREENTAMLHNLILQENLHYWTRRAPSYSEVNQGELSDGHRSRWSEELCRQIDNRFPQKRRETIRVLEAGTGPGFFAILLAEAGYAVTAIDLTPNMLAEARKNAGELTNKIDFREMNAEALRFADGSFDVVISRNLTWNLPHPEQAYAEWCRVLVSGGLLLNFDANWYAYLFDGAAKEAYQRDRKKSAELGLDDLNVGENFDIMEHIAQRVPLSAIKRPDWDVDILTELGMRVYTDCQVWERVWDRQEKTNCASTPMFLVRGAKSA